MAYRRSRYDDLAYGDEPPRQHWDRDRFERMRARSRGPPIESIRFDERETGPRGNKEFTFTEREYERSSPRRRTEFFDDDYAPPRRPRPEFLDRDPRYETTGRELAPWRNRYDAPAYDLSPPSRRPGYLRRQSSWDAGDRARPRYDDHDGLEVDVRINSSPHRHTPERDHHYQRYAYPEIDEEDYRDVRIKREREIFRRSNPARRRDSVESDEVSTTTVQEPPPDAPKSKIKRGRTKMPKRLVHKKAIVDLGFPFVEEEDFYIVQIAMAKDQIDTVIKVSETYRQAFPDEDAPKALEAPPPAPAPPSVAPPASVAPPPSAAPPPPASVAPPASAAPEPPAEPVPPPAEEELPNGGEITETVTTKIIENPTPSELARYGQDGGESSSGSDAKQSVRAPKSHVSSKSRGRSRASRRSEIDIEERIDERESLGGPLTLVSRSRHRSERDIKEEIRQLEAEKKALKYEREADEYRLKAERAREDGYEYVDRDVIRVEKDRNGRLFLKRSAKSRSKSR